MCGTVMRGANALPGSKATSRAKGSHRNLDISCLAAVVEWTEYGGPHWEGEEPKPMMQRSRRAKRTKPTAEASAGANAAESVERRVGAKGNTYQHNTYWTQSQARVTNALVPIRPLLPLHTRGGSRMRESRTYGSGRRACDETHVPTATPPRVHHAARQGGRMAAHSARAAATDSTHRRYRPITYLGPFPARLKRAWVPRWPRIVIEYRSAQGQPDRLAAVASELAWPSIRTLS
jgi:hypothetical protein